MSNEYIKAMAFREENYPEVVRIGNELAALERRSAHDSLKLLITEEGQKKIDRLKLEKRIRENKDELGQTD